MTGDWTHFVFVNITGGVLEVDVHSSARVPKVLEPNSLLMFLVSFGFPHFIEVSALKNR